MKANELRIGNWVMGNTPFQVEANDIASAYYYEKLKNEPRWNPILLTEERLVSFGFVGRKDFMWKGVVGVQIKDAQYYVAMKDLGNVIFHSLTQCKYVHQLQNLYFALTGEELKLQKP